MLQLLNQSKPDKAMIIPTTSCACGHVYIGFKSNTKWFNPKFSASAAISNSYLYTTRVGEHPIQTLRSKFKVKNLNWFTLKFPCTVVHSMEKSSRRCGVVEKPERRNYCVIYVGALECMLILTSST